MANVDQCVRYSELAMCEDIDLYGERISQIPNANRVMVFRNKNKDEIVEILRNCKKTVQLDVAKIYYDDDVNYQDIEFTSDSNNNRDGADIIHTLESGLEVSIELKFGQKTDRAIGMAMFEKIFESDYFTKALTLDRRREWVAGYVEEPNIFKQRYRLVESLNEAVEKFNNHYDSINRRLSAQAQEYMESVIINNTGDGNRDNTHLLRYIIEGSGFKEIKRIPTGVGFWTVDSVKPLGDKVNRVNIFVFNSTTNVQIKYTLNWKNNYRLPNGDKVSAKLGLGSPSWNVWIEVEVTRLS